MFKSKGILRYVREPLLKVVLEVDPGIVVFYRSLMPKWIDFQPQKYPAHISVVRKEQPPLMDKWGLYEGEEVEFFYENTVSSGQVYFWLNAFSKRLEEIRESLGLELVTPFFQPTDLWKRRFHISLGNKK